MDRIKGSGHVRRKRRTHDRTPAKIITPKNACGRGAIHT